MSFKAGDQAPRGGEEKDAHEAKFESTDEMIAFARGYFASDFPNLERTGCPKPGTISEIVRAGKQPDAKLRAHLFGCSECFVGFDREMRARGNAQPAAASWWSNLPMPLLLRPVQLLVAVLCVFLIALAGIYLRHVYLEKPAPDIAGEQPNQVSVPPSEAPKDEPAAPTTPRTSPTQVAPVERAEDFPRPRRTVRRQAPSVPRPRPPRQDAGELSALNTVRVDLEEYSALRGGGDNQPKAGRKVIFLRRAPTLLKLRLPKGHLTGAYSMSVVDAFDKPLVMTLAHSTDGKSLQATLDARKFVPGEYRLRLAREGEAPEYFPLVVRSTGKKFRGRGSPDP